MGFFGFGKKQRSTHILIDIGSASVGGAYAHFDSGRPTIHYAIRERITPRDGETVDVSMVRTLEEVSAALVREGAPAMRRAVGSAHADGILVSIAAPWQETVIRGESTQAVKSFVYTKKLQDELIKKNASTTEGRIDAEETVIATILNGYEIPNPFGKQVKRVELVILSSTLQKDVTDAIRTTLRKAFHSHEISFTGFAPASYHVFKELYPLEHDYMLLDIRGVRSDLAFVQRGLLLDAGSVQLGTYDLFALGRAATDEAIQQTKQMGDLGATYLNTQRNAIFSQRVQEAEAQWIQQLSELLRVFATRHALPRTLFLLADDDVRGFLIRALDTPAIHSFWLSDEPLRIVPVTPAQFSSYVRLQGDVDGDIFLELLALYHARSLRPLIPDPEPVLPATPTAQPAPQPQPSQPMVSSAPIGTLDDHPDFSM